MKDYTDKDYTAAIRLALNYPPEITSITWDSEKDIYIVHVVDGGLYKINLTGSFIRAALKWRGERLWVLKLIS